MNINIIYKLYGMAEQTKQSVKDFVGFNIKGKLDSYLKSVFNNKPDANILIDIKIEKTKKGNFDGKFIFLIDGNFFVFKREYKILNDLVSHAFDHLKQHIGAK